MTLFALLSFSPVRETQQNLNEPRRYVIKTGEVIVAVIMNGKTDEIVQGKQQQQKFLVTNDYSILTTNEAERRKRKSRLFRILQFSFWMECDQNEIRLCCCCCYLCFQPLYVTIIKHFFPHRIHLKKQSHRREKMVENVLNRLKKKKKESTLDTCVTFRRHSHLTLEKKKKKKEIFFRSIDRSLPSLSLSLKRRSSRAHTPFRAEWGRAKPSRRRRRRWRKLGRERERRKY